MSTQARSALSLRKALKIEDRRARAELLQDAQNELRYVDAAQHPDLVNAISAKILAAQGRGGDSEIAHVTPGEMVLHPSQLSPRTRAMILADLASQGVTPATRTVGTGGRRNPATGAAQFSVAGGCDPGLGECINDRLIPDGYRPGPPPAGVQNYTFTYDRGGNPVNPGSAPVGVSAGNRAPPRHGGGGGFLIGSARAAEEPDTSIEQTKDGGRWYDPIVRAGEFARDALDQWSNLDRIMDMRYEPCYYSDDRECTPKLLIRTPPTDAELDAKSGDDVARYLNAIDTQRRGTSGRSIFDGLFRFDKLDQAFGDAELQRRIYDYCLRRPDCANSTLFKEGAGKAR